MTTHYDNSIEKLSGSYRDIGRQHGLNNAYRIRYLLQEFGVGETAAWDPRDFLEPLEKHLPDLVEEIHGIAEGSNSTLKEICGLAFQVDLGTAATACTGVAFASGPDGPVMGKTSDCTPGIQRLWMRPRLAKPTGQHAALMLSHVGSPNAEMGMNERGLAIGITGLPSDNVNHEGVGWQQDIRAILHHCTTTVEAIDMLRGIPIRGFGYCLVIVDRSGDVAICDKVSCAIGVKRPAGNVAYVTNVPQCPNVIPHAIAPFSENGHQRMALLSKLCADEAQMDFSLEGAMRLFLTHGKPAGLCQHGPELHTTTGFFMLPQKGKVRISQGYTCKQDMEDFHYSFNSQ